MKNETTFPFENPMFRAMDPKFFPSEALFDWLLRPRIPVLASNDKLANIFISAMLTGETVKLIYLGGSHPGELRWIKVSFVFQHEPGGPIYIAGYCLGTSSNRVFALDSVMAIRGWN
jgi:hypothetical protein